MARKRRGREPLVARQLFAEKLKILFGDGPRRPNPALDALVGNVDVENLADDSLAPTAPAEAESLPNHAVAASDTQPGAGPQPDRAGVGRREADFVSAQGDSEPVAVPAAPGVAATSTASEATGAVTAKRSGGRPDARSVEPYTVYLTMHELTDIDYVIQQWSERHDRHFSRSEVMRVAIRTLRAVVEELDDGSASRTV